MDRRTFIASLGATSALAFAGGFPAFAQNVAAPAPTGAAGALAGLLDRMFWGFMESAPPVTQAAIAAMDAEINRQALMIAYIDDFHFMLVITLAAMPLVWLLRKART